MHCHLTIMYTHTDFIFLSAFSLTLIDYSQQMGVQVAFPEGTIESQYYYGIQDVRSTQKGMMVSSKLVRI